MLSQQQLWAAMAWESCVLEARKWVDGIALGFAVSTLDEAARRISFRSPVGSFYITVPEKTGQDEWGVWSEEDSCISLLSSDMDYLTSPRRTLTEILEKAASCLGKAPMAGDGGGGSEEEESGEDLGSDDDDDFDAYYGGEDEDPDSVVHEKESPMDQEVSADDFFTGQGSPTAVHRLLSDMKTLKKAAGKYGISGGPRGDNLFLWDVELCDFEKGSLLQKDLEEYAQKHSRKPVVDLEMKFPKDYPMSPPFVRIIRPRFQFLTGHVTVGGSICMQMLTKSGWSPSNDIESILVQVRAEIMSDPKARLDPNATREYSEHEAKDAFERMVRRYGWGR